MRTVVTKKSSVILASAARTTTGQSPAFDEGNSEKLTVLVDVTAVSGTTPQLTVNVEWSHDGSTWFVADTADAFAVISAAKKVCKQFDVKGLYVRLNYTISGTTPSFTFSATAVTGS